MKRTAIILALALLAACTLPQTTVRTGSTQPSLVLKGAPEGSTVYVDGLSMGDAKQFDGNPKVLAVLEGTHKLEIRQGSNSVYSEKVFVASGETHVVTVVGGGR